MAELPPRQNPLDRPDGYSAISSAKPKRQQQQAAPTNFIGKVATSGPGKILLSGLAKLEPLSVPRNIVQSTLKEVADLASGKGFSKEDWNKQRKEGTGPLFNSGNKWVDRLGGLAVDIGTDPLMYLHLGKVHSISALERAASGARFVEAGGSVATGAKIAQRGSYFLTDAERALAGYSKAGVYFMGGRIAGTARIGKAGEQTFAGLRMMMGRGKLGEAVKAAFSPVDVAKARTALRLGKFPNDEAARYALFTMNSPAKGRAAEKINIDLIQQEFGGIRNQQGEAFKNFDNTVHRVMENPELVVSPQEQGLANVLKNQLKSMHERLAATGQELYATFKIGEIKNYFPHVPTRDGFKEIRTNTKLTKILEVEDSDWKTPGSFLPRQLKKDETFFDYVLKETDLTVERLNQIARNGGFKGDFFETSVTKVFDTYAANYSKQMGRFAQFEYMKKTGAVDYITSVTAPSNAAINIGKERVSYFAKSITDREAAIKNIETTLSELESRSVASQIGTATDEIADIASRTAGQRKLLKAVQDARVTLEESQANLAGLFDETGRATDEELRQLIDSNQMIGQQIQETTDALDSMAEILGRSIDASHSTAQSAAEAQQLVVIAKETYETAIKNSVKLTNMIAGFVEGKEFLDANLIRILSGETVKNIPAKLKDTVKKIKAGGKRVGAQRPRRGDLTRSAEVAVRRRQRLEDWWNGASSDFGLGVRETKRFSTKEMNLTMATVAQGSSSMLDLQTVTVALAKRIDDFYGDLPVPDEITRLYDDLLKEGERTGEQIKRMNKAKRVRQLANSQNSLEARRTGIATFEKAQSKVDELQLKVDNVDKELDAFSQAGGIKNRQGTLQSPQAINQQYWDQLQLKKSDLKAEIQVELDRLISFDSGSAKVTYSLRGGNVLPSAKSTKGLRKKTKGTSDKPIKSLEDLRESYARSENKLQIIEEGKTQRSVSKEAKKVKELNMQVSGSREQELRHAVAIERLFYASEGFRRASDVQDLISEFGVLMDEKAFRFIFRKIAKERVAVWDSRTLVLEDAKIQLGSLEAAYNIAVEAGGDDAWKAFVAVRDNLLAETDTSLTSVVRRGQTVDKKNMGQALWNEFSDARSKSVQIGKSVRPTEAYTRAKQTLERRYAQPTDRNIIDQAYDAIDEQDNLSIMLMGPSGDTMGLTTAGAATARKNQAQKDLVEWYNTLAGQLPGQKIDGRGRLKPLQDALTKRQTDVIRDFIGQSTLFADNVTQDVAKELIDSIKMNLSKEEAVVRNIRKFFKDSQDTQKNPRKLMVEPLNKEPLRQNYPPTEAGNIEFSKDHRFWTELDTTKESSPLDYAQFLKHRATKINNEMSGSVSLNFAPSSVRKKAPLRKDFPKGDDGLDEWEAAYDIWSAKDAAGLQTYKPGAMELQESVDSAPARAATSIAELERMQLELRASKGRSLKKGEKLNPTNVDEATMGARRSANKAIKEFESSPEYSFAVSAKDKYEILQDYAPHDLDDVNKALREGYVREQRMLRGQNQAPTPSGYNASTERTLALLPQIQTKIDAALARSQLMPKKSEEFQLLKKEYQRLVKEKIDLEDELTAAGVSYKEALALDQELNAPQFTQEEWDSLFIQKATPKSIGSSKAQVAELEARIVELKKRGRGYTQAKRKQDVAEQIAVLQNKIDVRKRLISSQQAMYTQKTWDTTVARTAKNYGDKVIPSISDSANEKWLKLVEAIGGDTPRIMRRNPSSDNARELSSALEFNWVTSSEKKVLAEYEKLTKVRGAKQTRALQEAINKRELSLIEDAQKLTTDKTTIDNLTESSRETVFEIDETRRLRPDVGQSGIAKNPSMENIPFQPDELQARSQELLKEASNIERLEATRASAPLTRNPYSEDVAVARNELAKADRAYASGPGRIEKAKTKAAEAKAVQESTDKQSKGYIKIAQELQDILDGKQTLYPELPTKPSGKYITEDNRSVSALTAEDIKNEKLPTLRKKAPLEEQKIKIEKSISKIYDKSLTEVEKAQSNLDNLMDVYGPGPADGYYGMYDEAVRLPSLQKKVEVLKEMQKTLGAKDPKIKAQVTKLIKDAEILLKDTSQASSPEALVLRSLETQRIGAEYHLAFSRGNLFREEATLKAIKDGVGGDMVGVLKEGWVRLGYPSDTETAALAQLTKQQRKDLGVMGPKKTEANVADLGFPGLQAPQDVVDSFQSIIRNFSTKQGTNDVFDFLGGYTRFFKAYATLSPGFHVRNAMSNGFAMLSADANIINLKDGLVLWKRYRDNPKTWLEGLSPKQARDAQAALEASFSTGSGRTREMLAGVGQGKLTDNRALQFSQAVGQRVEGSSRFMLSYDGIIKGMDSGQAGARVTKYLFDYSNPSMIDEKLRNIVPFWTWMSRNLPLQLVNRWTNPRAYVAYENFVKSVSQDSGNDAVPQYMREAGAFKIANGLFLQPDLGFNRVQQTVTEAGDPARLLSYVNPALRLPAELSGNRKYYSNQPFSDKPQELKGVNALLAPFLQMAGMTNTGANGSQYTSDKTMYAMRNLLPTFAQGERLFPSTEGGNQKRASSVASWMGIPIKQLTPAMEKSEKLRRKNLESAIKARRKNLGY